MVPPIDTIIILFLCVAGFFGHIIAISILCSMKNPSNILLMSMSCTQLILCINYLYTTLYKYLADVLCISQLWSVGWVAALLASVNISVIAHTSGVFHVAALAILRYISLKQLSRMQSTQPWFTNDKSVRAICAIVLCVIIACIPFFFNSEVRELQHHGTCAARFPALRNITAHELAYTNLARTTPLGLINFWIFGTICKLVPCIVLVIMSLFLIKKMKEIHNMTKQFKTVSREKNHLRTTIILLIIMVIFVIVELPQGILSVVFSIYGVNLLGDVGEFFDILSLLNICIVFGLLCSMNSRIRKTIADALLFHQNLHLKLGWCHLTKSKRRKCCSRNKHAVSQNLLENNKQTTNAPVTPL